MKTKQSLCLILACSTLVACGGGGSSSSSGPSAPAPDVEERELVFEFSEAPLEPTVFNIAAGTGDPEDHFSPNDTISITWKMEVYYDDQSVPEFNESFPYTASVYLSEDGVFQQEDDLELFSISCMWPSDSDYACGQFASFDCDYAPGNQNVISCSSIPVGRTNGINDLTVDTSAFLNVIPKSADMLYVACLDEQPNKCTTFTVSLQLN